MKHEFDDTKVLDPVPRILEKNYVMDHQEKKWKKQLMKAKKTIIRLENKLQTRKNYRIKTILKQCQFVSNQVWTCYDTFSIMISCMPIHDILILRQTCKSWADHIKCWLNEIQKDMFKSQPEELDKVHKSFTIVKWFNCLVSTSRNGFESKYLEIQKEKYWFLDSIPSRSKCEWFRIALVKNPLLMNHINTYCGSVLHRAIQLNDCMWAEMLIEYHANVYLRASDGKSIFRQAIEGKNVQIVKLIYGKCPHKLQRGLNILSRLPLRFTEYPHQSIEVLKCLIDLGANPFQIGPTGHDILDSPVTQGHIRQWLLEHFTSLAKKFNLQFRVEILGEKLFFFTQDKKYPVCSLYCSNNYS